MPGLKKGSSGGICNNGSGQAVKCDCGCTCPDCSSSGPNYGSFNLATSGITVSTGCVPNTSLNRSIKMLTWPTINGFMTMANGGSSTSSNGNCCTWQITSWPGGGSAAITENEYSPTTSCTGTPTALSNVATAYLFKISGKWIFIMLGEVDGIDESYAVFFYGEIATSSGTDCLGPTLTFTNSLTVGNYTIPSYVPGPSPLFPFGGLPAYAVGSGGTAVVSP